MFRNYGATALWLAVRMNLKSDFVPLLLENGAKIDMGHPAKDGTTIEQVEIFVGLSH